MAELPTLGFETQAVSAVCPPSEAHAPAWAFAYLESVVTYLAYLDEFGHVGPYIDRQHPQHNDSPVFGFAGLVLPVDEVRGFGTWFFQRKCQLLEFELARSGKHPALWEKKGSTLYTVVNVERYRELRRLTLRMFNKIEAVGGFVLYVGVKKTASPALHSPNRLYTKVLLEAVKRIDQFCEVDCNPSANFLLALDEHDQRAALITEISRSMYAGPEPRRHLIEPLFNLESHRYQTIQAADWIAGLVGRLGAIWADPDAYPENVVFRHYFEQRLNRISRRSGIRTGTGSRSQLRLLAP